MNYIVRAFAAVALAVVIMDVTISPCFCANVPTVLKFGLAEVSFRCPDSFGNPFDPEQNNVWATVTGAHGSLKIPAFYDGNGIWKARFAPENIGDYHVTLSRNGVDETQNATSPTAFLCIASIDPGFVRVAGKATSYPHFAFDSGTTYFPLGMDTAWQNDGDLDYPELYTLMCRHRMNFARVWMTFWDGKALDWAPSRSDSPVPGTFLLASARRIDTVLESATSNGIYVQLTLQHHGQVSRVVDPNWSDSPYNSQNSNGFLADPDQFFTDSRVIAITKAKYRYIVARYAWCDHLMGFEIFNEIQNNPDLKESDYIPWHNQMVAYIRSLDPYHHLITTSYTDPSQHLAQATDLDYLQAHNYPNYPGDFFLQQGATQSVKPLFWGEYGAAGEQSRNGLHNGLWAGLMVPVAGAPEFWYWDLVQHQNWWPEFDTATRFADLSGLAAARTSQTVPVTIETDLRGPLALVPGLSWSNEKGNGVVTVDSNGVSSGMEGIPCFIQGKYHHDMMPAPLTLKIELAKPTLMHVDISSVSASGAHLAVTIDGVSAADRDLPGNGSDLAVSIDQTVTIPAGAHIVVVQNTGLDHFTLDQIVLDDLAPAAEGIARNIGKSTLFWVQRRRGSSNGPISLRLQLTIRTGSNYSVTLFDTHSGASTPQSSVKAQDGVVILPVNLSGQDIAGWITDTNE